MTRPPLLPLDDALKQLLAAVHPLDGHDEHEYVSTFDADGCVLCEDIVATLQVPPQDNSSMDGYAVRCADVTEPGVVLQVTQRIAAGESGKPLEPLSAARIFTGAPIPPGADAVVMQEDCEVVNACEGGVRIQCVPQSGQWIRRAGEDVERGSTVLAKGTRLNPASLGMAASVGREKLCVAKPVRVALFSTGDELVMPGTIAPQDMKPGAIYNSNRFFLRAMLMRLGCVVTDCGIVPDKLGATQNAIAKAAQAHDVILTSGGVSVGEEDHIRPAVQSMGRLDLWQIAIKPGKPFAFGHIGPDPVAAQGEFVDSFLMPNSCLFVGLPGNPVSSFVTFMLLVRPLILRLLGSQEQPFQHIAMRADFDWPRVDKRREFLRVRRNAQGGLDLFPNQSSGVLTSAVWGDGLVDNPPGQTIAKGDRVQYLPFAEWIG